MPQARPLIVGLGGSATPNSSTEQALVLSLAAAAADGAETRLFGGDYLAGLPHYLAPGSKDAGADLITAIRMADGLVIASPGYHGSISGLVKNAIDDLEETARDSRVYLDGVPVGLIATAYGWQATASTIATLRSIVHALRGWPTPMAITVNSVMPVFAEDGSVSDPTLLKQLDILAQQVVGFARMRALDELSKASAASESA